MASGSDALSRVNSEPDDGSEVEPAPAPPFAAEPDDVGRSRWAMAEPLDGFSDGPPLALAAGPGGGDERPSSLTDAKSVIGTLSTWGSRRHGSIESSEETEARGELSSSRALKKTCLIGERVLGFESVDFGDELRPGDLPRLLRGFEPFDRWDRAVGSEREERAVSVIGPIRRGDAPFSDAPAIPVDLDGSPFFREGIRITTRPPSRVAQRRLSSSPETSRESTNGYCTRSDCPL
jgi:hypothetical protein